jgi:hypothetical protein
MTASRGTSGYTRPRSRTGTLSHGPINCPAEFGSTVRVAFHRPNQKDQAVIIALTGCAGPPGRIMSDALRADLERLAPRGFGHSV